MSGKTEERGEKSVPSPIQFYPVETPSRCRRSHQSPNVADDNSQELMETG
jgi:hypothetical protein